MSDLKKEEIYYKKVAKDCEFLRLVFATETESEPSESEYEAS